MEVIYRHPNTSIKNFKDCLESTLDKIKHKKRIIICGDMNISLNKFNSDNSTTEFVNGVITYNFLPYTLLPTRIMSYCANIIDHVYSNINFTDGNYCKAGLLCSDISDHCGNFMIIGNKTICPTVSRNRPFIRLFTGRNINNFKASLVKEDWSNVYCSSDLDLARCWRSAACPL